MADGELRGGDIAAWRGDELAPSSGRVGEDEPFSAIAHLLSAAALREDGKSAEALDLVCQARTILVQYLPEGDGTVRRMDETISDLRGETANAASP